MSDAPPSQRLFSNQPKKVAGGNGQFTTNPLRRIPVELSSDFFGLIKLAGLQRRLQQKVPTPVAILRDQ